MMIAAPFSRFINKDEMLLRNSTVSAGIALAERAVAMLRGSALRLPLNGPCFLRNSSASLTLQLVFESTSASHCCCCGPLFAWRINSVNFTFFFKAISFHTLLNISFEVHFQRWKVTNEVSMNIFPTHCCKTVTAYGLKSYRYPNCTG